MEKQRKYVVEWNGEEEDEKVERGGDFAPTPLGAINPLVTKLLHLRKAPVNGGRWCEAGKCNRARYVT